MTTEVQLDANHTHGRENIERTTVLIELVLPAVMREPR